MSNTPKVSKRQGGMPTRQNNSSVRADKPGTVPMKSAYHRQQDAGTPEQRAAFARAMRDLTHGAGK